MSEYDIVDELDREIDDEEALYDAIERFEEEEFVKTKDIVTVVRCENCIHHHTFACRMINPADDDFCKYGESME